MTEFKKSLHSPKNNLLWLAILIVIFRINDRIFKHKKTETFLWDFIKCELFYIGGQCQNSGNCCKQLMIVYAGHNIDTQDKLNKLINKNKSYTRFNPNFTKKNSQKIKHFNCSSLNQNNLCNDYKNRPTFCRNYPMSSFIKLNEIQKDCGYKVQKKTHFPTYKNKRLQKLIQGIKIHPK